MSRPGDRPYFPVPVTPSPDGEQEGLGGEPRAPAKGRSPAPGVGLEPLAALPLWDASGPPVPHSSP